MKQYWERLSARIDKLTLRERVIVFGMLALVLVVMMNTMLLDAQSAKQRQLSQQIKQDQAKIASIQSEIMQGARLQAIDPDAENRQRLETLRNQAAQIQRALREMHQGLVSPDKMPELLQGILRQHGKVRLVSLRTLPAAGLSEAPATELPGKATKAATPAPEALEPVFKHGVELTVQGSYGDILGYMKALEASPWQLYWSNARLSVDEHPNATLVLTLFTLSLDKRWLST